MKPCNHLQGFVVFGFCLSSLTGGHFGFLDGAKIELRYLRQPQGLGKLFPKIGSKSVVRLKQAPVKNITKT
jgi:hypothetical protein